MALFFSIVFKFPLQKTTRSNPTQCYCKKMAVCSGNQSFFLKLEDRILPPHPLNLNLKVKKCWCRTNIRKSQDSALNLLMSSIPSCSTAGCQTRALHVLDQHSTELQSMKAFPHRSQDLFQINTTCSNWVVMLQTSIGVRDDLYLSAVALHRYPQRHQTCASYST